MNAATDTRPGSPTKEQPMPRGASWARRHQRSASRLGFSTAVAVIAISLFSAQPASAASAAAEEQVTLSAAEAAEVAATAAIPAVSPTGLPIDKSAVEGWRIEGVVIFVSYELQDADTSSRSLTGAYLDASGATVSTVDVVGSGESMQAWSNGARVDIAAQLNTPDSSQNGTNSAERAAPTTTRDFCWYLNKYAEGEIALGTLVAAAGGVAALFSGPVGGAVAAAGGLKAALGGMYKWLISLWCI